MSVSDIPAPSRTAQAFWPTPAAMRHRAGQVFAVDAVLPIVLDLARGVAALAVLAFHLRTWLMVPYAAASQHGPVLAAFYFATTFGHEAVIVFFVLSGFLIGGTALRIDFAVPGAVWSYAAARGARIVPALVGAVALSLAADWVVAPWRRPDGCHDTAGRFLGNLLALGNLGVPTLCNNNPLWSLSNELAYYIAFPTLVALVRGRRSPAVAASCAVVLAICAASLAFTPFDQQNVVLYFPAWCAGAALWWIPRGRLPLWPGVLLFGTALAFGCLSGSDRLFIVRDTLTTLAFTLLLAGLLDRPWPRTAAMARLRGPLTAFSSGLAAISFSIYVTHHPVIDTYAHWVQQRGITVPMSAPNWLMFVGLFGACIGLALIFSQIFERPHRAIADLLVQKLRHRPAAANRR